MTEIGRERNLEEEPHIDDRSASRIARRGLNEAIDTPAENPEYTKEFKDKVLSIINSFGGQINPRRLFYELFKLNINDVSVDRRSTFFDGINALVRDGTIIKDEHTGQLKQHNLEDMIREATLIEPPTRPTRRKKPPKKPRDRDRRRY